jgi:hypothetical protein
MTSDATRRIGNQVGQVSGVNPISSSADQWWQRAGTIRHGYYLRVADLIAALNHAGGNVGFAYVFPPGNVSGPPNDRPNRPFVLFGDPDQVDQAIAAIAAMPLDENDPSSEPLVKFRPSSQPYAGPTTSIDGVMYGDVDRFNQTIESYNMNPPENRFGPVTLDWGEWTEDGGARFTVSSDRPEAVAGLTAYLGRATEGNVVLNLPR